MFNVIEEPLDLSSLNFSYIRSSELDNINRLEPGSADIIIVFASTNQPITEYPFKFNPQLHEQYLADFYQLLDTLSEKITKTGTLYIYGLPQWLPYFSVYLNQHHWNFKYWIALETSHPQSENAPMMRTHEGILLYVRNKSKFSLRKVRSPHQKCDICGDYAADWGGKKHLRSPLGYAISDVWDDVPQVKDENHILSKEVWERLVLLTAQDNAQILCVSYDGVADLDHFIFE